MSPPIREGSGDSIGSIRLGDGSEIAEVRTGAGDVLFSAEPPDSGDLRARYDAIGLSKSDGDPVSTWSDTTGNANDLTAGVAPAYQSGAINSEPAVRFNGADEFLDVSFSQISAPFHVFLVGVDLTGSNSAQTFFYDGTSEFEAGFFGDNSSFSNTWTMFSGSRLQGGSEDANPHIWSMFWDGSNATLRLDGSQIAKGDPGSPVLNGFTLGSIGNQNKFGNVDIGEVLLYPTDKRSIESDAESFLSNRWGISI